MSVTVKASGKLKTLSRIIIHSYSMLTDCFCSLDISLIAYFQINFQMSWCLEFLSLASLLPHTTDRLRSCDFHSIFMSIKSSLAAKNRSKSRGTRKSRVVCGTCSASHDATVEQMVVKFSARPAGRSGGIYLSAPKPNKPPRRHCD